ncbi:DUF1080 domain-containing protein [Aestuariibaculum sp. TT11]|uniref:DUF1080 domain-containing protein n=2 Tax=Aestuariibaculum sediminum TaxID=2770637 RepID=A0A8J6Q7Z7_9FLAO|nr:DUF1080 domain-containing protein [Aestuariibaculum sediminum]
MGLVACKNQKDNEAKIQNEVMGVVIEHGKESYQTSKWEILFDGTSMDSWRGYLMEQMPESWTIEDGAMVFMPKKGGGNIITKKKYTNFELYLEWKISEGGNSGFFWGVSEDEAFNQPYQTGPEIQVLDNERHPDAFKNPKFHQAGALYDLVQPKYDVCKPAGQWNACVLKIDYNANHGSVTLNGKEIVEFPLKGKPWEDLVENSKFKGWEGFGVHHTGHIGLQDHGDKVWYKNIKIRALN